MRVTHVAGQDQLADLATKMQPRLRLHQLLRLWGFMGSCFGGNNADHEAESADDFGYVVLSCVPLQSPAC